MNADASVKTKRKAKDTVKVDFDRTPFWQRMKAKYLSMYFLKKLIWALFRYVLLIGISYVILSPSLQRSLLHLCHPMTLLMQRLN